MLERRKKRKTMKITHRTDVGLKRVNQEDFYYIDNVRNLFVVADGMGGHAGGEIASKTAVETFVEKYKGSMSEAIIEADKAVMNLDVEKDSDRFRSPGTTLIIGEIKDFELTWGSVGDSYIYHIRNGECRVLNPLDQHPLAGYLTQALGGHYNYLNPHVGSISLEKGDIVIFATDGIEELRADEFIKICNTKQEDLSEALVEKVLEKGARDNVTIVCVEMNNEKMV